jgi:hypothetical protein
VCFAKFLTLERFFLSLLGQVLVIVEATERLFQAQIVPLVVMEIRCHSVSLKATDEHTRMPSIKSTKTYHSF